MVDTYKLSNRTLKIKKNLGTYCQYSGHMCNIFSDIAYLTVLVTIKKIKDNIHVYIYIIKDVLCRNLVQILKIINTISSLT